MSKRRAGKQLTEENWDDDEEEPASRASLTRAPEDVLAKREFRKACRSLPGRSPQPGLVEACKPNPFAGISLSRNGPTVAVSTPTASSVATMSVNGVEAETERRTSDDYLFKVAQLNRDILRCISRLLDTSVYLNLTPCFNDYIKHFQRLTNEEDERRGENNAKLSSRETDVKSPDTAAALSSSPPWSSGVGVLSNTGLISSASAGIAGCAASSSTNTSSTASVSVASLSPVNSVSTVACSLGSSHGNGSSLSTASQFSFGLSAAAGSPKMSVFGGSAPTGSATFTFGGTASSVGKNSTFVTSVADLNAKKNSEVSPKALFSSNVNPKSSDLVSTATVASRTKSANDGALGSSQSSSGGSPQLKFSSNLTPSTKPSTNNFTFWPSPGVSSTANILASDSRPNSSVSTEPAVVDNATNEADSNAKPQFKFGSAASTVSSFGTAGFSFSATAPSAGFGVAAKAGNFSQGSTSVTSNDDDDDTDAPPKVEITPVHEEGSLYNKKVKLFYQKNETGEGGRYMDKGVGYLHVKKLEKGGYQLLVRALSTLGNVLLNIRLSKDIPIKRVGKNNVGVICIANPPLDPSAKDKGNTPTIFLIRLKSMEDADELCTRLTQYRDS